MANLSEILTHYFRHADENLERIENAIFSARAGVYTANQAVSDWVTIWANIAHCWKVTFDFSTDFPRIVEFFIAAGDTQSDPVTIKVPMNVVNFDKFDLMHAFGSVIPHGSVQVNPTSGPPPSVQIQLTSLTNLQVGIYTGPLVLEGNRVVILVVRVRP